MAARRGDTLLFPTPPVVAAHAAIGGKKEGEGPLAACFDELSADNFFGQSNWEAAEKEMALRAARLCLKKAETTPDNVSLALAGDLQAQCTASSYALRELGIPYVGHAQKPRTTGFRRAMEPKFVGDQTGLSPVLSLLSVYVGMKLGGVLGMILGPVLTLVLLNLASMGLFRGLRADLSAAAWDVAAILSHRPEDA